MFLRMLLVTPGFCNYVTHPLCLICKLKIVSLKPRLSQDVMSLFFHATFPFQSENGI